MKLHIEQSGWSNYRIYEDREKLKYTCSSKSHWAWKPLIFSIFDTNRVLVGRITARFKLFRKSKILFELFEEGAVKSISLIESKYGYEFIYYGQHYTLYLHKRHHKSLFKNDEQVALFNKDSLTTGGSDSLYLLANSDENEVLMICLAILNDLGDGDPTDISFDFGRIFGSKKEFDKNWKPKR